MIDPNATSIVIATLGLLGLTIGAIIWVAKWAVKNYGEDLKNHTRAALKQAKAAEAQFESIGKLSKAVDRNTESNNQVLTFMKNLNGRLTKITQQKINEQTVEHQTIQHVDEERA